MKSVDGLMAGIAYFGMLGYIVGMVAAQVGDEIPAYEVSGGHILAGFVIWAAPGLMGFIMGWSAKRGWA